MAAEGTMLLVDEEPASVSEAVDRVFKAATALVEDRIELGRLELRERSSRIGAGVAFLGIATFFAACAWVAIGVAGAFVLARVLPESASVAIVAGVNLLLAALLAWLGRRYLTRSPAAEER